MADVKDTVRLDYAGIKDELAATAAIRGAPMDNRSPVKEGETFGEFQKRLKEWHKKDWVEHLNDEPGLDDKKARLENLTERSYFSLIGLVVSVILYVGTKNLTNPLANYIFLACFLISFIVSLVLIGKGARPFGKNSSLISDHPWERFR